MPLPPQKRPEFRAPRGTTWGQSVSGGRFQRYVYTEQQLRSAIAEHAGQNPKPDFTGSLKTHEITRRGEIIVAAPITLRETLDIPARAAGINLIFLAGANVHCYSALSTAILCTFCTDIVISGLRLTSENAKAVVGVDYNRCINGRLLDSVIYASSKSVVVRNVPDGVMIRGVTTYSDDIGMELGGTDLTLSCCNLKGSDLKITVGAESAYSAVSNIGDILVTAGSGMGFSGFRANNITMTGGTDFAFSGGRVTGTIDDTASSGGNAFIGIAGTPTLTLHANSIGQIAAAPAGTVV